MTSIYDTQELISAKTVPKIDCHTHIVTAAIRDEYFSRTDGLALVMQMPDSIMKNPDCVATVLSDPRLFLCAAIDLKAPIAPQLNAIAPKIEAHKIVGLKIYLTYQRGRADDEKMTPVYDFARRHRLTVTFHTGLCSLVLPTDNDMAGSDARHIERAAQKYPDVNFVIAHLDDPRFRPCVEILARNDNLYSDVSGAYETGTKEGNDVDDAIEIFKDAILSQPGMEKKILYGTDFCPLLNMGQLDEYDTTIERIFRPRDVRAVYFDNCLRAFPRLSDYII
ncbi:MAG: amidohydrolase family protein [Oscillospiraceae bacterium]|nr:amidohydrolase family protein [Oscillospiraceae bacterium]